MSESRQSILDVFLLVGRIDDVGQLDTNSMITVEDRTLPRITRNCSLNRLVVTGQLPGSTVMTPNGTPKDIEQAVLKDMGLDDADWQVEKIPRLSTKGTRRPLVTTFKEFQFEPVPIAGLETMGEKWHDGVQAGQRWHPEGACIRFRFTLPSGSYATTLLREFMRSPLSQL
ncbi:MAG TPA: tRNA pseudouridine(13) synthase TruD [Candidatus Poseidoniales archaeon]|nr:tRNA pseudouridine(13) synthase TruD [Candidatus Poseidoniales archaeon]